MTKLDDLEAVRVVVSTLHEFEPEEVERILRWAREKLGMAATAASAQPLPTGSTPVGSQAGAAGRAGDVKSFVAEKQPKSDAHFAATIAYFYQFEAPEAERKQAITKDDLVEACRKTERKRPAAPAQVLVNAFHGGLFDRGERGLYQLNSVGENLVAMVLPGTGAKALESGRSRARRKGQARKQPSSKSKKKK